MTYALDVGGKPMSFGSKIEAEFYRDCWFKQYAGELTKLRQPGKRDYCISQQGVDRWGVTIPALYYTPDVEFVEKGRDWLTVVEVKPIKFSRSHPNGYSKSETTAVIMRYTLFRRAYPNIELRIVKIAAR